MAVSLSVNRADARPEVPGTCRDLAPSAGQTPQRLPVRWILPEGTSQRRVLDRWCGAVGPVVTAPSAEPASSNGRAATAAPGGDDVDELPVVTWNVHVGGGDIDALVGGLRSGALNGGRPARHFVLLLQEAHRRGSTVPRLLDKGLDFAAAIQPALRGRAREDVAAVARRLHLHLFYVPSMRNGAPTLTDEDRGNAILSTLPLDDLVAVELPFERQRRVAILATVRGRTSSGMPWQLVVGSLHLDSLSGVRNLWVFSGPARQRQARGFLATLPGDGAAAVGGDLNSWFGYRDPAYLEMAAQFRDTPASDRRPTFGGFLRLDHLFFRVPHGWTTSSTRLDDRFGSDHYPVLGRLRFPS